jgi:hypothetical protein
MIRGPMYQQKPLVRMNKFDGAEGTKHWVEKEEKNVI